MQQGWLVLTQIWCVPIIQTMTKNDSFFYFVLIIHDSNSLKFKNAVDISFFLIASGGIISLLRPWTSFVDCRWDFYECELIGALNGELSCVSLLTSDWIWIGRWINKYLMRLENKYKIKHYLVLSKCSTWYSLFHHTLMVYFII